MNILMRRAPAEEDQYYRDLMRVSAESRSPGHVPSSPPRRGGAVPVARGGLDALMGGPPARRTGRTSTAGGDSGDAGMYNRMGGGDSAGGTGDDDWAALAAEFAGVDAVTRGAGGGDSDGEEGMGPPPVATRDDYDDGGVAAAAAATRRRGPHAGGEATTPGAPRLGGARLGAAGDASRVAVAGAAAPVAPSRAARGGGGGGAGGGGGGGGGAGGGAGGGGGGGGGGDDMGLSLSDEECDPTGAAALLPLCFWAHTAGSAAAQVCACQGRTALAARAHPPRRARASTTPPTSPVLVRDRACEHLSVFVGAVVCARPPIVHV